MVERAKIYTGVWAYTLQSMLPDESCPHNLIFWAISSLLCLLIYIALSTE